MEDEKRPAEVPDLRLKVLDAQVFEELPADGELPSGELDLRFALALDRGHVRAKAGNDVFRVGRCRDGHHRPHLRQVRDSRQHGGATKRVADQQLGGTIMVRQVGSGPTEILHVRGEVAVRELAARRAEPREVEPQHGDAPHGQLGREPLRGENVFRAGEAMGEDRVCTHGSGREIEPGGQGVTAAAGELDALSRRHSAILRFSGDDERHARVEARWTSMVRLSHRAIAPSTAPGRVVNSG